MSPIKEYLVVGSGGMARRYVSILKSTIKDSKISCLPMSENSSINSFKAIDKIYESVEEALEANPKAVFVASPAPTHLYYASAFLKKKIPVLIEKPLSNCRDDISKYKAIIDSSKDLTAVAYCLRYLPSAQRFKEMIQNKEHIGQIHKVIVEVGQYLPDWRPEVDYRNSVSANKEMGGGALLELSHEIDYINWLFGSVEQVSCHLSNSGFLEIDVEDSVDAIFTLGSLKINLHMDFLQRAPVRYCKVIGEEGNLIWDILSDSISFSDHKNNMIIHQRSEFEEDFMYKKMIENFLKLEHVDSIPSVEISEASKVLDIIETMRLSSESGKDLKIIN